MYLHLHHLHLPPPPLTSDLCVLQLLRVEGGGAASPPLPPQRLPEEGQRHLEEEEAAAGGGGVGGGAWAPSDLLGASAARPRPLAAQDTPLLSDWPAGGAAAEAALHRGGGGGAGGGGRGGGPAVEPRPPAGQRLQRAQPGVHRQRGLFLPQQHHQQGAPCATAG